MDFDGFIKTSTLDVGDDCSSFVLSFSNGALAGGEFTTSSRNHYADVVVGATFLFEEVELMPTR